MIGFQLGREYKLCVAEILSVFKNVKIIYFSFDFLVLDNIDADLVLQKANNLGGVIKIIEINDDISILNDAKKNESKFNYGISIFGDSKNLKKILIEQKKELRSNGISSRFVNKNFTNLISAQILGEKLINKKSDYNYIYNKSEIYFGKTIWVQNINEYSKRDYSKSRDMQIGMLPPKLCQIMINLGGGINIYDPFVGLGSILIESILMGNKNVYGSDSNPRMVETASKNINKYDLDDFNIINLNAKYINESEILLNRNIDSIITEGYLGEIMTRSNISLDRINKQIESLSKIYKGFFSSLKQINYSGNIIICFPFWELNGKYVYFDAIYNIINQYCEIENLLPKDFDYFTTTKSGSLLYKRDKQLVGREIFKLKIK